MFQNLRKSWIDRIFDQRLHLKFLRFLQAADSSPPFSDEDIQPFRDILSQFLTERGRTASWEIREDQPLHLSILQQLSYYMHDADRTLFPCLQDGVSTGFDKDIPPSSCFPAASNSMENAMPLSVHLTNWQSAENDLETTRHLVQQELDKGWVYKYPGTLADAQVEFGEKLSVGRLGLALSDTRPPRLVVDSSICGLNSQVEIPERTTLPSALDVLRVYPLRNLDESLLGFSLDVKSAHKLVVLRQSERGLVGFSLDGAIYFYKVCPFGASFSAYHWTRLGSFILRCFIKTFLFLRKGPKPIPSILEIYFLEQKQVAPRTASCPSLSLAGTSNEADSTYSLHYLKHFWARKWTECVTNFYVSFFARPSLVHVPSGPQIWGTWVQVDRPLDDRKIH